MPGLLKRIFSSILIFCIFFSGLSSSLFAANDIFRNLDSGFLQVNQRMHMNTGDDSRILFGPNSTWGAYLNVGAGVNNITPGTAQVISTDGNLHLDSATVAKNTYINWYSQTNTYINGQGGNVGIGTTSPSYKLDVTGTYGAKLARFTAPSAQNLLLYGDSGGVGMTNADPYSELVYLQNSTNSIHFYTNGSNKGTINSSGNFGIGTTSPSYKLQVQKTSSAPAMMIGGGFSGSPRLQVYGLDADANAWMGLGTDMGGNSYEHSLYFPTGPSSNGRFTIGDYNGTTYNTRMTVLQNGNVGIGTTSPVSPLNVRGNNSYGAIKISPAADNGEASLGFTQDALGSDNNDAWVMGRGVWGIGNDFGIGNDNNGVGGSTSVKFLIQKGGNVGIGTTSPGAKLDVNGTIRQGSILARPLATWSADGATQGAVIIKLPGTTGNYGMLHIEVDTYEYNGYGATKYIIGGHNWNGQWYNTSVQTLGKAAKSVRLGFKDGQYAIILGGPGINWSYGHVVLSKITTGGYYAGIMDLGGTYTITQDNSADSYTWITGDLNGTSFDRLTVTNTINGNISGNAATATNATNATNAISSTYTNVVNSLDGDRNAATKLPTTTYQGVRFDFVNAATANGGGNYAGVMTYAPWVGTTASTGDASYQLAFNSTATNGGGIPYLSLRKGIDSTWNSWYTLLHSGNFSSYAPSLTGGGASGTWGINITGSAGSATNATRLYYTDNRSVAPNSSPGNTMNFGFTSWNNNNAGPWADFLHMRSYADATGGNDNLLTFRKDTIGARLWQQTYNSSSPYSTYRDFVMTDPSSTNVSIGGELTANEVYSNGWLRNNDSGEGIYNQATSNHFYSDGQYWNVGYAGTTGIRLRNGHAGSIMGYLYGETTGYFGLLDNTGAWGVRINPGGGGTLLGNWLTNGTHTANTLALPNGFQIQQGGSNYGQFNSWVHLNGYYGFYSANNSAHFYPNNGSYGSWRVDGSRGGYAGIEFGAFGGGAGNVSIMANNDSVGFHNATYGWMFNVSGGNGYIWANPYGGGTQKLIIDSGNIGSQTVSAAATATTASNLGGYGESAFLRNRGFVSGDSGTDSITGLSLNGISMGGYSDNVVTFGGVGGSTSSFQLRANYNDALYFRASRDSETQWDGMGSRDNRIYADNYHPLADNASNSTNLGGVAASSYARRDENNNFAGYLRAGSNVYTDGNYGYGLVGLYSSTRYQGVFAMGDAYKLAADGSTPGSLYGIAWTHSNVGGQSIAGLGHQALFMENGITQAAIGNGIWTRANITAGGTIQGINLDMNRDSGSRNGISWYSPSYTSWSEYMAPAGEGSTGPYGNITAPTGSLVTSWGLRSFIENASGYGWTWESGTSTGQPTVVAEIRASDGSARFAGTVTAATPTASNHLTTKAYVDAAVSAAGYVQGGFYGSICNFQLDSGFTVTTGGVPGTNGYNGSVVYPMTGCQGWYNYKNVTCVSGFEPQVLTFVGFEGNLSYMQTYQCIKL